MEVDRKKTWKNTSWDGFLHGVDDGINTISTGAAYVLFVATLQLL